VASVAEWLLAHEQEIGCRYDAFDLYRPRDDGVGGQLAAAAIRRQLVLLARFWQWLRGAPRLVHYCVSCSSTGLVRDVVFVALLRLRGRVVVAHVHGPELSQPRLPPLLEVGLRLIGALTHERVAVSPAAARRMAAARVSSQVIVNPIRVVGGAWPTAAPAPTTRLLFVGTYGRRKGVFELVEAVASVRARGFDVSLEIVGQPESPADDARLRELVASRDLGDAITFAGIRRASELGGVYSAADLLCLPSYQELLPMVLLEAMSCGVPVIATRVGGIPDLVDEGRSGLLVDPGDVDELADAISSLAGDAERRRAMSDAARARARAFADPGAIVARWRRVYSSFGRWAPVAA
jgi:glycosyltransferase involved in cell wall biosynthesis